VELQPLAYRDPVLRQLHSEVSILEQGKVVRSGVIEVNQPLTHRGVTIYQTVYGRDKFGFWSAGFQFTRDPGEPVVWLGCIGLVAGLLLAFAVPYRVVGVTSADGEILFVALAGFRGEGGQKAFDDLERGLGDLLAAGRS
jgi:cytochrome c biogenesis protein